MLNMKPYAKYVSVFWLFYFQRDFESLVLIVIIIFWLLQMASSRRTYTAGEAARHILEGDGSELNRIDVDLEIKVCLQIWFS